MTTSPCQIPAWQRNHCDSRKNNSYNSSKTDWNCPPRSWYWRSGCWCCRLCRQNGADNASKWNGRCHPAASGDIESLL